MMKTNFYTLLYVDLGEKRYMNGHVVSNETRIDVYVKGAMLLDKSLKQNGLEQGLTILTNNENLILQRLKALKNILGGVKVKEIPFALNVPKGIAFYSAHFKIDVFKWFAGLPADEYNILVDTDVFCLAHPQPEFYRLVENRTPLYYNIPHREGIRDYQTFEKIADGIVALNWAGGEFIGGTSEFFGPLYADIMKFASNYFDLLRRNVSLHHVGDEMLTSIAIERLKEYIRPCIMDAGGLGIIYRYWSNIEAFPLEYYNPTFAHLPNDKAFFLHVPISKINSTNDFYKYYHIERWYSRIKTRVRKIITIFK